MKRIFLLLLLTSILSSQAQNWDEIAKGLPTPYSQNLSNQYYGCSVAIDGNYAVVGAYAYEYNGAAFVLFYNGTSWETKAKLIASDAAEDDNFACSVSISDNNIVVGANKDDDNGNSSGSAYVFTKPTGDWVDATETAKLTASDASSGDYFGYSVSISDNNIVVGAYLDNNNGSAYVFTKPEGDWVDATETAKLTASDAAEDDVFAYSVSISGNNIVIGALGDDSNGSSSGSAYIYTKPTGAWVDAIETAKLTASDAATGDSFGKSVCIDGDNIVIGAYGDNNGSYFGSAYVYTKPAGDWIDANQTAKLTAPGNYFGYSVSISGDNIVVGAYQDNENGNGSGSAYIFTKSTETWTDVSQTAKLTASDAAEDDLFAYSVSISGDNIITGAYHDDDNGNNTGSAYIFTKPIENWITTTETTKLIAPIILNNINNIFGSSICVDGNYAIVGAYGDHENKGAAYVLFFDGNNWNTQAKLTASDAIEGLNFGESVSISGNNILVGAHKDNGNGSESGSAYVFTKPIGDWVDATETAKLTASDASEYDAFGISVSISDDNIIVGAWGGDNNNGCAYVFTKPIGGDWVDATETAKLTASDATMFDYFGYSVSISGNNIVIGANANDNNGITTGSAYVYTKPIGNWVDATETAKLTASNASEYDAFGFSVGISNDNIVIGAYGNGNNGCAYVFTKPPGDWVDATETAKLTASDTNTEDWFGKSVSISNNNIVIGAFKNDDNGSESGSAYVYTKPTGDWEDATETEKLTASDANAEDWFGKSVSISNNNIVIGAAHNNDNGNNTGSAYLFRNCEETSHTMSAISCDTYTSPSGKIWTISNTYTDTILNTNLCDSIITINLTINPLANNNIDTSICYNGTYIYADGTEHTNITNNETYISTFVGFATNGCDSLVTENITVLDPIDITVNINNQTITANASNLNYQWIDCNNNNEAITGETNQSFTATSSGNYAVIITDGICSSLSECFYILGVGVNNIINNGEINIYPNPASNNIKISNFRFQVSEIIIIDLAGKIVKQVEPKNSELNIQIGDLEKGVYFVRVGKQIKKLIIN